MQFQDVSKAGRRINQGLDLLTMGYITGSHFKPGYGGFGGETEQNRAFKTGAATVKNQLNPDRIKFFKDAHFDHCDKQQPLMAFTSMNSTFDEKDMSGKRSINEGNIAYSLRH